jgi:hypothetical protein
MTRILAVAVLVAVTGCVTSKLTSQTYDGGKVTGGTVDLHPSATAAEASKYMDDACGVGKWKVVKDERVFLNHLGNVAPDYGTRRTFACL